MKKTPIFAPLIGAMFTLAAYAPGRNELVNSENAQGKVAGFWQGLGHGFIAFFTFLVSLFNENVSIYEVHNNGKWYDFGFILGVMMFFGGSRGGSRRD
jgi:hypothetical protein